ncbi:MAG: hypothetical protein PSU94_17420 [Lacunisphaera sp.]|nr:hypothetical protein [Lacunisphaera sp.]
MRDHVSPGQRSRMGGRSGLRGASFNNNERDNLASSNRNTNDNRNNNIGFRVVCAVGSARKVPEAAPKNWRDAGRAPACPAGAKRPPNRPPCAPVTGKIRGARRGR